jgi:hypothetical protein
LLLLFPQPSVSESFSPLDGRLNWIPASGLVTGAVERGVFVELTLWSLHWQPASLTPFTFAVFPSLKRRVLSRCVVQPLAGLEVQLLGGSAATLCPIPCDLCGLLLSPSKISLLGICSS